MKGIASSCVKFHHCIKTASLHLKNHAGIDLRHCSLPHRGFCQFFWHDKMENSFFDQRRKFTVAVEGNIGSGKTNMLQYFSKFPDTTICEEPVNKWRNVQGHNLLGLMYSNPERWSLTFQTYVQLTMLDAHKTVAGKHVKLMERSIFSAKYCFVENLHKSGKMPAAEYIVLTEWFNWIVKNENIKLDLIVYLKTSPEVVHQRIKERARNEETGISVESLNSLHNLHEDWLIKQSLYPLPAPVLVLNGNGTLSEMDDQFSRYCDQILCRKNNKTSPSANCDAAVESLLS